MSGAIVTPHIAGSGRHVRQEIARVALDDLEQFFMGNQVANRVTAAMLDRMTASLEAYVAISAPAGGGGVTSTAVTSERETTSAAESDQCT